MSLFTCPRTLTPRRRRLVRRLRTRWSSAFSDPQWLEVDLGSTQSIGQVVIYWQTAYAKAFQIQTSNDNSTWTTIYSTDSTGATGSATFNWMVDTAGGGEPAASFWGNTSAIPAAAGW